MAKSNLTNREKRGSRANSKQRGKIKVVANQTIPFIIESNGKYSGFEIELWEMVAKEINVKFEYIKCSFQEVVPLVAAKKADVGLAAMTINEQREEVIDFSHPTFQAGLHILLSKNRTKIDFASTIRTFIFQGYKQLIKPLLVLLLIIFIFGNVLWFGERFSGSFTPTYIPGIFQAIWLSLCTIIGSDGGMLVYGVSTWYGRLILTLGQLTNLAVLGLLIGELTAFITTKKIRLHIEGPNDLKGKIVATVKDSTSEPVLKRLGAKIVLVTKIDEAYEKLRTNKVEAVVFDSPDLIYYALNNGSNWAEVVGEIFDNQDYGLVLQEDSPLRERINRALLIIRENGLYETLYKKWFGNLK